jgi:hypothetical protein
MVGRGRDHRPVLSELSVTVTLAMVPVVSIAKAAARWTAFLPVVMTPRKK